MDVVFDPISDILRGYSFLSSISTSPHLIPAGLVLSLLLPVIEGFNRYG